MEKSRRFIKIFGKKKNIVEWTNTLRVRRARGLNDRNRRRFLCQMIVNYSLFGKKSANLILSGSAETIFLNHGFRHPNRPWQ